MTREDKKLIYLLAGLNILNFADRYILSAVAPSIQRDLGFTDGQLGMIGTAFLWGFVLASPFVGTLMRRFSPQLVLAFAVISWSAATAATGVVRLLFAMVALRAIIGIGQAIFSTASPPLIDSIASKSWKAKALSFYYAGVPIGIALGFIAGGFMDMTIGWEMSFIIAGIIGIPVALLLHRYPIKIKHKKHSKHQILALTKHPKFIITVIGHILQGFTLAGFAFWAPIYFSRQLNYPSAEGSIIFGIIFITTGFTGTLLGGWLVGRFAKNQDRASLLKMTTYLMLPASMLAFCAIAATTALWFFITMAFVQLLLFATYTPFAIAFFQTVPKELKETASGVNTFLTRLLGDMLGIWLIGALSVFLGSLSLAMYILPFMLVLATVIWWRSSKVSN
jgi:MFS transporter, Spinster family, sphingosine-1-phosphate transporter